MHADMVKVKQLTPLKPRPGMDLSKYCSFHRRYGHKTDDYYQLKDAIEQLIREGKLQDYVQRYQPLSR